MPTQAFGVYPAEGTLGDEVSSTYEGRHITLTADEINQGNVLALVTKGYPVIFGPIAGNHGVGVALKTEVLGTDLIAIDTEGIWNVSVEADDDAGNSLVTGGDPLYINTTTCVVSKRTDEATHIPFGYALGQVASGAIAVIAVKVHWDPPTPEAFAINGALSVGGALTVGGACTVTGSLAGLEHFSVGYDATIGRDLSVLQHFSVAWDATIGRDLTVVGHLGTLRAHVGNGATFTGAITNLTVEDGIVTAAS